MVQVQTEAKPIVNRTQALTWLRQMMLIRRFEERAEMLYQKGNKIGGFFHQYSGQEPVAVGSIGVLRENDYVMTAYRGFSRSVATFRRSPRFPDIARGRASSVIRISGKRETSTQTGNGFL